MFGRRGWDVYYQSSFENPLHVARTLPHRRWTLSPSVDSLLWKYRRDRVTQTPVPTEKGPTKRSSVICLIQLLTATLPLSQSNAGPRISQSAQVMPPVNTLQDDPKAQAMILRGLTSPAHRRKAVPKQTAALCSAGTVVVKPHLDPERWSSIPSIRDGRSPRLASRCWES